MTFFAVAEVQLDLQFTSSFIVFESDFEIVMVTISFLSPTLTVENPIRVPLGYGPSGTDISAGITIIYVMWLCSEQG